MATSPKVAKEQRSFADHGTPSVEAVKAAVRRDRLNGAQSGQFGDADVNLGQQARYGNLKQNLTTHWKVQER